jgi:hypothetical protein
MFLKTNSFLSHASKLSLYGEGEWIDEPDSVGFDHAGIACEIMRHTDGFLIGLCNLPKDHPWAKEPMDKVSIDIHGNLFIIKTVESIRIGFSCDMTEDLIPRKSKSLLNQQIADAFKDSPNAFYVYRNLGFVTDQCRYLAEQVIEAHEPEFKSRIVYKHDKNSD